MRFADHESDTCALTDRLEFIYVHSLDGALRQCVDEKLLSALARGKLQRRIQCINCAATVRCTKKHTVRVANVMLAHVSLHK
jgi:hypothetical protein